MRYGTSHFVSRGFAENYYRAYGFNRAQVAAKIAAGEIHVGEPELKPGQKLTVIRGEGRYQIEDRTP